MPFWKDHIFTWP